MALGPLRDFSDQARVFDRRAGLPSAACDAIAGEIVRIAALGPADMLLEVGAGTGQIGHALCSMPLRYFGFDASAAMLAEFAQRCRRDQLAAPIAVADAGRPWPLRDGSATVIFGSRSLHLLPPAQVVEEALRVAAPTRAYVLIGRVQRDPDGLRARLRREMRACLARCGHRPREGQRIESELLDAFICRGARPLPSQLAATWPVARSAGDVIAAWRAKPGLAGIDLSPADKEAVLSELAMWAQNTVGSLDMVETNRETYVLDAVQLPSQSPVTVAP